MIRFIIPLFLCIICPNTAFAQTSCSNYYPFSKGATSEITTYDKKGKIAAVVSYTVSEVTNTGTSEVAAIQSSIKDDKGELIAESTYDVTCSGGIVSIDFKSLVTPQLLEQFENMEYEVTGNNIDFPNNLTVGQELPDAEMKMRINMGGINMNMNVSITDRKVIGKEHVTTPAGSFEAYIIEYTSNVKMGMNRTGTAKQWIAEGVGMVKQEDYNNNGKVVSSSLLTGFTK